MSQNGTWKDGMIDFDSGSTRTMIDSENWLKSSEGSGVKICSGSGSKSRSWNPIPHSFPHNGIWFSKIGDLCSRMTGIRIKTDYRILFKLGNKTRVNIDSEN